MKLVNIRNKVGYQIFPRSFMDYDNDGNGDLNGIISKLDYLKDLGVDILWLCPIYKTKFKDAGYDVIDYFEIDEMFGDIDDFKNLVKEAKKRKMDIMMDVVLNHGSDQSYEFKQACKSKTNPYHDFFIWNDKPNLKNESIFGGSAWEYVKKLDSYYLHIFSAAQPDFNYDNPKLRQWIYKMLKFWIDLGVKYFRLDAVEHVGKTTNPYEIRYGKFTKKYLAEMYEQVFKNTDAITVGESWSVSPKIMKEFTDKKAQCIDTFFNFSMLAFDWKNEHAAYGLVKNKPDFSDLKDYFKWQNHKNLITATSWTNHDIPRALQRYFSVSVSDKNRYYIQTVLSTLILTTRGIPFLFQGEEFGMSWTKIDSLKDIRDGAVFQQREIFVKQKKIYTDKEFLKAIQSGSRDLSRSTMSWNSNHAGGFSMNSCNWINESSFSKKWNLAEDLKATNSIFKYTKKLIKLRKTTYQDFFVDFDKLDLLEIKKDFIMYQLIKANKSVCVVLNFANKKHEMPKELTKKTCVFSNYKKVSKKEILPFQAAIFK